MKICVKVKPINKTKITFSAICLMRRKSRADIKSKKIR